ncbi:MAG: lysylphosphatidylglycerol synthase transmembrane domain-containing protein [Weeksellaceae bacterium]
MKSKISQLIFTILAIVLAAVFIGLTIEQTDFEVLKSAAKRANYFWFFASMVLSIFTYWLRAARWKLLLEPIGYKVETKTGFWAISFAYFMNLTIPRSGEVARATSFYKMEKVPVNKSFGTIVLERVIDLIFLGLFFGVTLILNAEMLYSFFSFGDKPSFKSFKLPLFGLGVILLLFLLLRKKLKTFSIYLVIENFMKGIWIGFLSILHLEERAKFIAYSVAIWTCYFFMTYLVIFAFPETSHFGLDEGFFLIVAGALGMILPAVGGLGYPYVMSIAFAAIFLSQGDTAEEGRMVGSYFGLMLYFAQVISILIFGFLSFYFIPTLSRKKE